MKKSNHFARLGGFLLLALLCLELAPTAHAGSEDFALCAKKHPDNNAERLKCYDNAVAVDSVANLPQLEDDEEAAPAVAVAPPAPVPAVAPPPPPVAERSYLTRAWNLDDKTSRDQSKLGRLMPHRQSYLLVRKTFNVNSQPASPAAGHSTLTPSDFDALETKFQFSFKADIGSQKNINFLGLKTLRLWGAYTQQSNWQMFNTRNSSMFRETNYDPELIATFGTGSQSGLKLVNLGLEHQSNGQRLPESRSWNRLYLQGGWEWGNTSVLARGWWRIPENSLKDDNPDITDYIGRADLVMRWEPADKSQAVSVLLRNNLSLPNNRGFMQVDWSLPVALGNSARLHAQLTSGFGESLVDYNHRQTTLGFGFSFREW
ncbi:MAG TPA: phospholipase A [Gallionella sp.]|nr:phospholipase A [Gallionella sp.]